MIAASITFGLFWVMQELIGVAGEILEEKPSLIVDFVRLKRDTEPEAKKREIPDRQKLRKSQQLPIMKFLAAEPTLWLSASSTLALTWSSLMVANLKPSTCLMTRLTSIQVKHQVNQFLTRKWSGPLMVLLTSRV